MLRNRAFCLLITSALAALAVGQTTYTATSLHPSGEANSFGNAISGGLVAGNFADAFLGAQRGAYSSGGAAMAGLNQGIYATTVASGTDGTILAGTGDGVRAIFWPSTSAAPVDLNLPVGYFFSTATSAWNGAIAGTVTDGSFLPRPALWPAADGTTPPTPLMVAVSGTANGVSASDVVGFDDSTGLAVATAWAYDGTVVGSPLHQSGWYDSRAYGTDGSQIVGQYNATSTTPTHAVVWNSSHVPTDLHPSFATDSYAFGVRGGKQVGYGTVGGQQHAIVWSGTAASAIDLHQFLPPGYTASQATGVDANGDIVGSALNAAGTWEAFVWKPAGYVFGPFLCPINDPATPPSQFQKGDGVLVRITLEDTNGNNAPNVPMEISVEKISGPNQGPVPAWRYQFNWYQTNSFFYSENYEEYWYPLNTQNLPRAYYRITATVDGASHSVVIRVV